MVGSFQHCALCVQPLLLLLIAALPVWAST
jgi:hypothetical protein